MTEEKLKRGIEMNVNSTFWAVDKRQSPDFRGAGTHLSCSPRAWQGLSTPQSSREAAQHTLGTQAC